MIDERYLQVRCPHCHSPIQLLDESPLSDIECPSCGSHFSLIGSKSTAAYEPEGTRKIAHFDLIEQVGIGQFGTVWKARDTKLDRIVAVKIPRKGRLEDTEAEQFLREARAAAQIRHSNIVSVHEVGREDDTIFIVSDFVDGANLSEWLSEKRLSPREAAELCVTLADALHEAHQAGITHRDLKPANIMMTIEGEPYIADFGLARREAGEITMTKDGRVLGTPAYMSPEQAKGEAHTADRRSDIYSLGVILFELLTGELPFRGETRMLIVQILRDEPPSPRKLNSRVPRDLETVCLKCMEKDPDKRYPTAKDVGEELRRFSAGEAITARPISRMARGWRWCKRYPMTAGLSATILLIMLTIAVVAPLFTWHESHMRRNADLATLHNRRLRYLAEMNMAKQAWEENDVSRTRDLLEEWYPRDPRDDMRGFEWFYLAGLLCQSEKHRAVNVDTRHGASSMDISATGDLAVAYEDCICVHHAADGSVEEFPYDSQVFNKPWLAPTGIPKTRIPSFWHWAFSFVTISKDGQLLAYRSGNPEEVTVVHRDSGRKTQLPGHRGIARAAAFAPDSNGLVSVTGDGQVLLWDLDNPNKEVKSWQFDAVIWCVAFSPNGDLVAAGLTDNTIRVCDLTTDEVTVLTGHYHVPSTLGGVLSVTFSPDGKFLVSGGADRTVQLWNMETMKLVGVMLGHTDEVRSVAVSPDGTTIASASRDHSIRLWDLSTLRVRALLKGHDRIVQDVVFSPDGCEVVGCGQDGRVLRWSDIHNTGNDLLWCDDAVSGLAITPEGHDIAAIQEYSSQLWLWHVQDRHKRPTLTKVDLKEIPEAVAISSKGVCGVFCQDGKLLVIDILSGAIVNEHFPKSEGHAAEDNHFTFSPDGSTAAMLCRDGTVRVWSVDEGELDPIIGVLRDF